MADSALSSDIEQDVSPPRAPSPKPSGKRKAKTRGVERPALDNAKSSNTGLAMDKDDIRWHQALERQFNKAQRAKQNGQQPALPPEEHAVPPSVTPVPNPPVPNVLPWQQGDIILVPQGHDLACIHRNSMPPTSVPPQVPHMVPEVTFAPTMAGSSDGGGRSSAQTLDLQSILSQAFASIFQAGLQQHAVLNTPLSAPSAPSVAPVAQASSSGQTYHRLEGTCHEEEYLEEFEFSNDDETFPEKPAFSGLFRLALFKSLLHKAKVATNMDKVIDPATSSQDQSNPNESLFKVPQPDLDFVPCPDLFSQVVADSS